MWRTLAELRLEFLRVTIFDLPSRNRAQARRSPGPIGVAVRLAGRAAPRRGLYRRARARRDPRMPRAFGPRVRGPGGRDARIGSARSAPTRPGRGPALRIGTRWRGLPCWPRGPRPTR